MESYEERIALSNIAKFLHKSDLEKVMSDIKKLYAYFDKQDDLRERSITWSIEDFEGRAEQMYGKEWETTYNENKFPEALKQMMRRHDANNGITWETIDVYLDMCCTFK
ncbi:MAG: hypothetical protein GY775_16650 [Candidatus Scalindua sp.]|nr:hypothetical protein [Candidatus Scalindua sp.]